eukprot:2038317-Alexandrium_andersonii.AAC.1
MPPNRPLYPGPEEPAWRHANVFQATPDHQQQTTKTPRAPQTRFGHFQAPPGDLNMLQVVGAGTAPPRAGILAPSSL